MIQVCYSEPDGPQGLGCRLEAAGHAGYAPAGQDIVCAGASTLMQALTYALAAEPHTRMDAWDEKGRGPHLCAVADAPVEPWVKGAFEAAKAGFVLLAERYPEHVRFADVSRSGESAMIDLQLFAEGSGGGEGAAPAAEQAPALSRAQQQQAVASGTLRAAPAQSAASAPSAGPAPAAPPAAEPQPEAQAPLARPQPALPPLPARQVGAVQALHARWAAEEAALRRVQPEFSLQRELKNPEMRRLMQLPGMRVHDAYRLAHYGDALRSTAQAVEQGVVERIRQRAARPAENGMRPGGAAVSRPDVAHMTRAQREALEQQALHGAEIRF